MRKPLNHPQPSLTIKARTSVIRAAATGFVLSALILAGCTDASNSADSSTLDSTARTAETPTPPTPPSEVTIQAASLQVQAAPVGTFVGRTEDSKTVVGIVSNGDDLFAYLCDGDETSSWFRGPISPIGATLTNASGATLNVSLSAAAKQAQGSVTFASGRTVAFVAEPSAGPGGLFRRDETRNGVRKLQGWVTLNDGTTVGQAELTPNLPAAPTLPPPPPNPNQATTTVRATTSTTTTSTTTTTSAKLTKATTTTTRPATPGRPVSGIVTPPFTPPTLIPPDSPTPDDRLTPPTVTPPTANGDLKFVIAAMGDSYSSGEGAPDNNGDYDKKTLRECRDLANQFTSYTEAEFAALASVVGIAASTSFRFSNELLAAADMQQQLQALELLRTALTNAERAVTNARRALANAKDLNVAATITRATAALADANRALVRAQAAASTSLADLETKVSRLNRAAGTILQGVALGNGVFARTATTGPLAILPAAVRTQLGVARFMIFFWLRIPFAINVLPVVPFKKNGALPSRSLAPPTRLMDRSKIQTPDAATAR